MSNNPYNTPTQSPVSATQTSTIRTVAVKRIDIISAALMIGGLYALLGLLIGGVVSLMAVAGVAAAGDGNALIGGLVGGVGALIILPLVYGGLGFIFGIIGAVLYNVLASMIGGIKIDLQS
ncbi:MAG: hypothetical protein P8L85_07060 [Rubripirellula sp.]|nr:hypothetical protein [Rubripirellula sp.]